MNETEFIEQRVDDQIDWYCAKSSWNQKLFKRLRTLELVCAASPLLWSPISQMKRLRLRSLLAY